MPAIAEPLRLLLAEIWRRRIEAVVDPCRSAAIVGVAHGTVIGIVVARFREHDLIGDERIRHRSRL